MLPQTPDPCTTPSGNSLSNRLHIRTKYDQNFRKFQNLYNYTNIYIYERTSLYSSPNTNVVWRTGVTNDYVGPGNTVPPNTRNTVVSMTKTLRIYFVVWLQPAPDSFLPCISWMSMRLMSILSYNFTGRLLRCKRVLKLLLRPMIPNIRVWEVIDTFGCNTGIEKTQIHYGNTFRGVI